MRRVAIWFALSFLVMAAVACKHLGELRIVTNEKGEKIALGEWNAKQLKENFSVFQENYDSYQPDTLTLHNLTLPSRHVEVITVLGTWCSDSEKEVPRFMKILDQLANSAIHVRYFCVDRSKKDGQGLTGSLEIERVPTFIIRSNGQEIGRIIESPEISLEEDLLAIFRSAITR